MAEVIQAHALQHLLLKVEAALVSGLAKAHCRPSKRAAGRNTAAAYALLYLLREQAAQSDGGILYRMVVAGLQVAPGFDFQVQISSPGQEGEDLI